MAAVPKNKISRVERGKRRAGNRPTLTKDRNSKVPLHKRGFVAQLLQYVGMTTAGAAPTAELKTKSVAPTPEKSTEAMKPTAQAPKLRPAKAKGKVIRQTPHKG